MTFHNIDDTSSEANIFAPCDTRSTWADFSIIRRARQIGLAISFTAATAPARRICTKRKKIVMIAAILVTSIIVASIGLYYGLRTESTSSPGQKFGNIESFPTAAVVTNGKECSAIGRDILRQNGSVADAAIAALFCEGVACLQSMGLGGGFLLTIYTKETGQIRTLDARETAPAASHRDMYNGNNTLSSIGGLAVAVPGELKGYWELHQTYGKLPWADLIKPTIELCKTGSVVTPYLERLLKSKKKSIFNEPTLREILINPKTNDTWKAGDKIRRLKLAETLEIISREGAEALYNGSLTKAFVDDIKNFNGIITVDDMKNYNIRWGDPIVVNLNENTKIYSSPLPGSGTVLALIMNILNGFLPKDLDSVTLWQRVVEGFKHAYGARTQLGDLGYVENIVNIVKNITSMQYALESRGKISDDRTYTDPKHYGAIYTQPEDSGTAHISVIAPNGDAIAVTSTINLVLGAMIRSPSTGIILNDEMNDFSDPKSVNEFGVSPSPANYIAPGKRPLSSMCPSIVIDQFGDVQLVIGAAGGSKITSAIAQVIMKNLWFDKMINDAIFEKRVHHQLVPMTVYYEDGFNKKIVQGLESKGHNSTFVDLSDGFAAVTAIARKEGRLYPFSDIRRNGSVAGY